MSFHDVSGIELSPWGASFGKMSEEQIAQTKKEKNQIVIGRGFFKNKIITVNYAAKKLQVYTAPTQQLINSIAMPYSDELEGITLKMQTQSNSHKMSLDTGSSISLLVANKVNKNESLPHAQLILVPT